MADAPGRRSPLTAPLLLVGALLLVALLAPLLAPHDPDLQVDPAASRLRPPGTVLLEVPLADGRVLLADSVAPDPERPGGWVIERRGEERTVAPERLAAPGATPERRVHVLGTDTFGRDLLSRILHGARVSLLVASLAVALALGLGIGVGAVAGTGPGWLDAVLMRGVDALLAFPWLILALLLTALFSPSTWLVVLVLGGTAWMGVARLVRAEMLGLDGREFVLAARGLGYSPARVLTVHMLPNALTPVVVQATLLVGDAILVESALSFLGLGVQPPTASWGNMVADGRSVLTTAWWVSTFPGLAIVATVVLFNLLGDRLRDALDPRSPSV